MPPALGAIRIIYCRFQVMMKKYDKLNSSVQENLIAIRVVKAFVRAGYEKDEYYVDIPESLRSQYSEMWIKVKLHE